MPLNLSEQLNSKYKTALQPQQYTILDGAMLGDGNGNVEVPGRPGWVYARMHDVTAQLVEAWNGSNAPAIENLSVDLMKAWKSGGSYYIVMWRTSVDEGDVTWGEGVVGAHHEQHERADYGQGGYDPIDVNTRAITPLRAVQQETAALTLYVQPGFYSLQGIKWFAGGNSPTFSPPGSGAPRYDLLYLDDAGALQVLAGTQDAYPDYPTTPNNCVPICYVYLLAGQTTITDGDIADARAMVDSANETAVAHNLLGSTVHGDTVTQAVTRGSLVYGNSTPKWDELVIGSANSVLTNNGTDVAWSTYFLVGTAAQTYTFPSTSQTIAGLAVSGQTFTTGQKINVNSTTALWVEQDGVNDDVFIVDTTNGVVGINVAPTRGRLQVQTANTDYSGIYVGYAGTLDCGAMDETFKLLNASARFTGEIPVGPYHLYGFSSILTNTATLTGGTGAYPKTVGFNIELQNDSAVSKGMVGLSSVVTQNVVTAGGTVGIVGVYSENWSFYEVGTELKSIGIYGVVHAWGNGGTTTTMIGIDGWVNSYSGHTTSYSYGIRGASAHAGINDVVAAIVASLTFTGGTTATAYGLWVPAITKTGGTITTVYGIYSGSPTAGGTNYNAYFDGTAQNYFAGPVKIDVNSTTALFVEQNGVKDNVFIVDTTNAWVGVNAVPDRTFKTYNLNSYPSHTDGRGVACYAGVVVRNEITSNTSGSPVHTLFSDLQVNLASDPGTRVINAFTAFATIPTGNSTNHTGTTLRGLNFTAWHYGTGSVASIHGMVGGAANMSTGTVTNLFGIVSSLSNSGIATITNVRGISIPAFTNAGTITNTYGIYIESMTTGTQTNTPYGIYQAGTSDINFFGGKVGIGGTPTIQLLEVYPITAGGGIYVANNWSAGASSGGFIWLFSTQTPGASGDRLGGFLFGAIPTGTTRTVGASVEGYAGEAWSATNTGSYMVFKTTTLAASARTEKMRLDAAGLLGLGMLGATVPPTNDLEIYKSTDGSVGIKVINTNGGTLAHAQVQVSNAYVSGSSAVDAMRIVVLGTGYTTTGAFKQDGGVLEAGTNLSGGMSIIARNASSGDIRFYTGSYLDANLRMTIDYAGVISYFTGGYTHATKMTAANSSGTYGYTGIQLQPSGSDANFPSFVIKICTGDTTQTNRATGIWFFGDHTATNKILTVGASPTDGYIDVPIASSSTNGLFFRTTASYTTRGAIFSDGSFRWDGDLYFNGAGSGLPYGSCWGNEIGWSQATAAQNTWYVISDTDMSDGQLNLVTHDGSGKLTVTYAGKYLITYSVSAEVSAANKHLESGIAINGSVQNDGRSHFETITANAQIPLTASAVLSLTAGQYIEIAIRTTDTGTPNLAADHLNISIVQVGG